ncbi:leucine-rich repeat-containing protein 37A-like [Hipposideros larvatus]
MVRLPLGAALPLIARCAHGLSVNMFRLSLWTPRVLFLWLLLWPLVMAAQPPELALDPVRLTSEPPGPDEPWSLHPSDLPPESAHVLTTPADPGSFYILGSTAAAPMLASPQELAETWIPFPDAIGDLPPEPDHFAGGLQGPKDKEVLAQPSERPEGDEVFRLPLEALAQPLEPPEPTSTQQEAPAQPAQPPEDAEASSGQQEAPTQPPEIFGPQPAPTQEEASAQPPELLNEAESSLTQQETPAQFLWEVEPSAILEEPPAQPPEYEEVTVPTQAQPPEHSKGVLAPPSVHPEVKASPLGPGEAQPSISHTITAKAVDLGLFITHQPTDKIKIPSQQVAPPQPPEKTNASPVLQEAPQQSLEPPTEVVEQPPVHNEMTLSASGQDQIQHSNVPTVTVQPSDMGLTKTWEPTTQLEHSTALTKTTAPPKYPHVTLTHPEQVQARHPNLTEVTIQPLDLEFTVTEGSSVEAKTSPTMRDTPTQPPEPRKEVVVQPPLNREVIVPNGGQDEPQHPVSPSITVHPLDLGLTVLAEPTMEAKPSTALTKATAPSPRHLEVTLPHQEQVQGRHPYLTVVTVQPVDLEVTITQQPESPETIPPITEQGASKTIDICQLCRCKDGTLSCTGLSPEQKLRRVPVLESPTYNGTFTIVNLQGNSISYIDENVWKSYRWVETLILSENHLSELHKDSFEGLLSLQYLDLSCNRIETIERRTFEPLPFVQFINLGCNSIKELSFGTFQAWHGMQLLHKVILDRNPLTTIEDSYLLKLPALRYLDMGRTQVSLTTVESILMMSLQLEKLILPRRKTCCLCEFKTDIDVVCKTLKLHCDTECLTDSTRCDEEVSIGNAEGSFMKVLQARKKNTSPELTIEPEKPSSDEDDVNLSAMMNDPLDLSEESDVISALNYILPDFLEGNLKDIKSTLLPIIKQLFSNIQNGDMPVSHLTNDARNPSLEPESNDATYRNKLRQLNTLKNVLDAEIEEKIDEVKKKEKIAMLIHSNILGPKLKRQIFLNKLETDQAQDNSPAKIQSVKRRRLRVNRVLKGPKGIRKRHFKELAAQSIGRKQNAQPNVENTAKERRLRRPPPRELKPLPMVHRPRKLVQNSFNAEPSFTKDHEAAVSSALQLYLMGRLPASRASKSLAEVKKSKDFSDTTFILDEANARVRKMEASEPISHSRKKHLFHNNPFHESHKKAQAKMSPEFTKEGFLKSLMLAKRPPISAVRRLINSPAQEAFASSGELTSQENPLPESFSHLDTSKETSTAPTPFEVNISTGKPTVPGTTTSEIPAPENVFTTGSAVTADNLMPTLNPSYTTGFTSPLFSSPGDQFENQLNQQLQSLIPNNDVRKLIAHVIRTLKMDCSEASVQLPCARLISRTGLLMKILSEEQEAKASKAEWDTDQWENENYISESTEAQSERKWQEPRERTKEVPGHGYHEKLILAISVTVLVMILIITFCVIEIHTHRRAAEEGKERSSRGFFRLLRKRPSLKPESQKGKQPLWLQDVYRPLSATRKKNLTQKTRDRDSLDEDQDNGELVEVVID